MDLQSIQRWKKKKEKSQIEGDLDGLFTACKELADIYYSNEKYDEALLEYNEMERVSDANCNKMDVARCNRMIGEIYCEKGEFTKAMQHQMIHLKMSKEQNDKVEEQRALATIGRTHFLLAESSEQVNTESLNSAKKYYMQSLSVCEQLSDDTVGSKQKMEMRARLFLNLGLVFDCQNQYSTAEDYFQKAVLICKKCELWDDLFRTYAALASFYHKNKNKTLALNTLDLALPIAERLSTKNQAMCEGLLLKSEVLLDQPNFRGARQALLRAFKINSPNKVTRGEIERKLRIVAAMCETEEKLIELQPDENYELRKKLYEDLGDMGVELGNFSLALIYYHLMLEVVEKFGGDKQSLIDSYVSLAQTYKDNKNYAMAVNYFKKELILELDDPTEACKTSMNIADLYQLLGKNDQMMDTFKDAKNYAQKSNNNKLISTVYKYMQRAFSEIGKQDLADEIWKNCHNLNLDSDTSDEEESQAASKSFGAHICLEDLSDVELGDNEQNEKNKTTRTRAKVRSNIQKRNEKGETPLHLAAIAGNATLVSKLIEQGHSVDIKDFSGWTPLHEACNHGHQEVVEILLKNGAAVNDRGGQHCDGVTPLLDAASNGNFGCIELLLAHGASSLMRSNQGDTALDCLVNWRKRYIEECGSDLDSRSLVQYNHIVEKLQQTLEKAGQKVTPKEIWTNGTEKSMRRTLRNGSDFSSHYDNATSRLKKSPRSRELISELKQKRLVDESAANEYECAMKALRYKNKPPDLVSPMAVPSKSVPALLNSTDLVGDDWLDDDLHIARPNKKRRTGEFIGQPLRRSSDGLKENKSSTPKESSGSESEVEEEVYGMGNGNSILENGNSTQEKVSTTEPSSIDINSPSTSGRFSNKLKEMNAVRKKQISLMASGVTKEKVGRISMSESDQLPIAVSSSKPVTCVKIKIEDKLMLVPIPQDSNNLTISWLAQEAASRYRSLEGVEPVLRLVTEDGALLVDSDPISLIMNMGDLVGNVQSWKLPPITTIYEEACKNARLSPDKQVSMILEACQASGKISFEDLYLSSKKIGPVFKALSHHQSLQALELSGNDISDSNIKDVAECVVKLPQLRLLDLSNTNISSEGLTLFTQIVQEHKGLQRLQSLNLGYNLLKDCLRPLSELLNTIPALSSLSLESIGLSQQAFRAFQNFTLDCLEILNVNFNCIGSEGIIDLLGRIDSRTIVELRFAGTSSTAIREVAMYLQQNSPPSLMLLDLSYCKATEIELQELIKGVSSCPRLEILILDGVPGMNSNYVDPLLTTSSLRDLSVCGLQANQVFHVEDHLAGLTIGSCVNQPWARRGPFGYFTNATH